MKKALVFILLLTFAFSALGIQAIADEEEYTFFADFTSGTLTNGWTLTRAAVKDDALVLAEGVSVSNNAVAATATYEVNKTSEKNIVIGIELDVKPGRNLTTIVQVSGGKSSVMPVTFDKSGEICINSYDVSQEKARTYTSYIPEKWYHIEAVIDQTAERLRTIVYDKESGDIVAQKQIVHYKPFDSWESSMSGGLKKVMLQTNMGNRSDFSPTVFDNLKVDIIPIGCSAYTEALGNNFGKDGTDDVHYKLINNSKTAYECELEWRIEEEDLGFVKSGVEKFDIKGLEEKEVVVQAEIQRYGLYKISAKLFRISGGERKDIGNDSELYISKVLSSDKGEFSDRLGFASHSSLGYYDENMKLMEMIGCVGTRAGLLSWQPVQSADGTFDYSFNQEAIDTWKASAMPDNVFLLAYGNTKIIKQVDFAGNPAEPSFYRPPRTPEEIERFGDYVEYVISRVGDYVDYYEVWNEFSGSMYSLPYGGELLAEICKEVQKRVKKCDPTAKVIGLAGVGRNDAEFVKEFFDAGGYDYCDAFSFHPYNSDGGGIFPADFWMNLLNQEIEIIRSYGPMKPIFFTEIGWSSAWDNTNEMTKARAIVKANVAMLAHDMAAKIYVHNIQNIGLNPKDREHQFAVLTANGDYRGDRHALPAFVVTAAMNKLLTGEISCEGMIEKNERLTSAYNIRRHKDNKNIAVMWSTTIKNSDFTIDLGCESVETYDEYGNFIETVYSDSGIFNFGISDKVMYAVGDFKKFEEAETVISHKDAVYISTFNDVFPIRISDKLKRNGRVELEYNKERLELISDAVMKDGIAEIQLKTGVKYKGETPINIKIFDESGKCIYVAQNTAEIGDPVTAEAKAVNYFGTDSRWGIEVTVHNNANLSKVKGVAKITAPERIAGGCSTVPFVEIDPQSSETVYIGLPEMLKKRTVTISGEVELEYGYTVGFSQYMDFTSAYYVDKPPTIDGKISEGEWRGLAMASDENANWTTLIKTDPWKGPDDNSLDSMKIMWDENNLYLAAVVKDDIFVKTPKKVDGDLSISADPAFYLWRYDSIQFGIEDEYLNVPNRLNYPFTEIGLAMGEDGPFVYRFSGQTEMPVGVVENSEIAITNSGNKTVYECAIPWSEVHGKDYTPNEELIYTFAALVNDNDGVGRKGYIMYNDGIGNGKKIEKFGQMRLKR
ncbi:MAG: hypothetical protein K5768_02685 [Firmicutes bacterium]|nr:hypothetical protein [Bacillota bacterium]